MAFPSVGVSEDKIKPFAAFPLGGCAKFYLIAPPSPWGEGTPVRTLGGMRGRFYEKFPVDAPSSVTAFTGRATFPPRGRLFRS